MEELKPCPFQCNLEQLNDRINNLSYGISQMSGNCVQVNKPFLEAVLSYMEELLGMRREEESRRAAPENPRAGIDTNEPKSGSAIASKGARNKRPIDAVALSEEIQHLQIFIGGESLFTPAIKETVLRTIDEQATVAAPGNKPLTLEQLRQMDGEPVWIKAVDSNDPDTNYWAIVSADMHYSHKSGGVVSTSTDGVAVVAIAYFEDYGKAWLAYARKPEGSAP